MSKAIWKTLAPAALWALLLLTVAAAAGRSPLATPEPRGAEPVQALGAADWMVGSLPIGLYQMAPRV